MDITPELQQAYRKAATLMYPDRATTDRERERRTALMMEVNRACEHDGQKAIGKLIAEYGQDPEPIAGADIASRLVKAISQIAHLRRRLAECSPQSEFFELKLVSDDPDAIGGDPLGDLACQLLQALSERRIRLGTIRQDYAI
jgi:hypothetical protein